MTRTTLFVVPACAALLPGRPAGAADWEAELAAGSASSNVYSSAVALQGRVGISLASPASASVRALDFAGGTARDGLSKAFSGWLALGELRLHTGRALDPARLHLALAAGVGRELVASQGPFSRYADPGPVETGQTGPAFLVSAGGAWKVGAVALSLDLAACKFTRLATSVLAGSANDGLGGALLLGSGVLP